MTTSQDAFSSPLDQQPVRLSIAARLVLCYARSRDYIDADDSLAAELNDTAATIARLVPVFRLEGEDGQAEATDLDKWAIRRGDLRTALQQLGSGRART